jgi:hypothetical protein
MIDELKNEIEKTVSRKIEDRGDCEVLVQDIYEKTGAVLSYNTLRRMYGLAEYRKPRESTLDQLSVYCGFRSYKDFTQRYAEIDTWPTWESIYVVLSLNEPNALLETLHYRKLRQEQFTISFTIVVRELINRQDYHTLKAIFEFPAFQFAALPYDEVAQVGVLIGLHFRNFDDPVLEKKLLLLPNFRDLVFKIFVDYGHLNHKYGSWISFLVQQNDIDAETQDFTACLELWRMILCNEKITPSAMEQLPQLDLKQHPILFGRIFGMRMHVARSEKDRNELIQQMQFRLATQPHLATELLYEPSVQSLVLQNSALSNFVLSKASLINDIKFWYHFSQVAIHRVFQVSVLISNGQYAKALGVLENIPFGHIRHGYREFIELYVAFFHWVVAKETKCKTMERCLADFESRLGKMPYPIFTRAYFSAYFKND